MRRSSKHQDLPPFGESHGRPAEHVGPSSCLGGVPTLGQPIKGNFAPSSRGLLCSHQWYVLSGGVPNLIDHSQLWVTAQVARFVSIGVFRVGVVGSFGVLLPATSCLSCDVSGGDRQG